jgi:hypothetical protein
MSIKRMALSMTLVVAIAGCLSVPLAFAASKSYKVSIQSFSIQHSTATGTTLSGTWHAAKLGRGTLTGTLVIPLTKLTYKRNGYGTFSTTTYNCKQQSYTPPTFAGCWKVTRATGKFKGMTGRGTFTGNIKGNADYVGSVKY